MCTQTTVEVAMTHHDDWIVNVLLSDGRIYSFWTEMWTCHDGTDPDTSFSNMTRATAWAKDYALDLAARGVETWGLDAIPDTEEQFVKALDFVCMHASDHDFQRFMQR